jgi:hypothetical protein
MTFHIPVICADPAVEATIAAALEPTAIAASYSARVRPDLPAMIGDVSWLSSPADVSPRSDLVILYDDVWDTQAQVVEFVLPIFSATRILILVPRSEQLFRRRPVPNSGISWQRINWIVVPFDPDEVYLRIYHMLKTPRAVEG